MWVKGFGFRLSALRFGFRVESLGFRVLGLRFRVRGLGVRVEGVGGTRCRSWDARPRRRGTSGMRVEGLRVVPGSFLEPLGCYWSYFVGMYRQMLTKSSTINFELRFEGPCVGGQERGEVTSLASWDTPARRRDTSGVGVEGSRSTWWGAECNPCINHDRVLDHMEKLRQGRSTAPGGSGVLSLRSHMQTPICRLGFDQYYYTFT